MKVQTRARFEEIRRQRCSESAPLWLATTLFAMDHCPSSHQLSQDQRTVQTGEILIFPRLRPLVLRRWKELRFPQILVLTSWSESKCT